MTDNIADLVSKLDKLCANLVRSADGAAFVQDGFVRVTDPVYLLECLSEAAQALTRIAGERNEALVYATNFLVSFVNRYCDPVAGWAPLPDLIGVLTQLDNASTVAGDFLARALSAEAERDRLTLEIEAARMFGGGFFAENVKETTRDVYRQSAREALGETK